jgi:hypothetical protein
MKSFRLEAALYGLAFLIALLIRLTRLGVWPLTDTEAGWALQALGVVQGTHPALSSQPAYILLTALFFFAFGGGTNFLARLAPALAGSVLVLVPWLFRERVKPRPALILAFFLAFDPGLVALSRQAGSAMPAVTFLLLGWGCWENKRASLTGICAGLTLMSGSGLWEGVLGLGLAWAIAQVFARRAAQGSEGGWSRADTRVALWFGLGTLLLGGTLAFLSPNGLSAWLASLPDYLQGWAQFSGTSASMLLFSLVAYQPLGVLLALMTVVRGWMQDSLRVKRLTIWMLTALLLALFYPARQVSDLVWMLIPLWALAALELARDIPLEKELRLEAAGMAALCVCILGFVWLQFLSVTVLPSGSEQVSGRLWILFFSLLLLVICILLVAVGWSLRLARAGAVWGLAAALGIYSFGAMLGAAGLRVTRGAEMWTSDSTPGQADLLLLTASQMSDWSNDNINSQPVTIVGIQSPALEWLLRGHQIVLVDHLDISQSPPFVITATQKDPNLASGYRGQSFIWREAPVWDNAGLSDWMRWVAFHQITESSETIVLWVRNDLFLDETGTRP